MAPDSSKTNRRKSRYTTDREMPGAFEGETVTRRAAMTIGGQALGGIMISAIALPALGFAVGPMLEDSTPDSWQDVGSVSEFNKTFYVPKVFNIIPSIGEAGKSTVYVRQFNPKIEKPSPSDKGKKPQPYVAISTRCMHLGCPVRYIQASQRFVCPCHGGVYDFEGKVAGGPPVRPLDRFYTRVRKGRVEIGDRFSVNSELRRFSPRDPSNHLDGLWQYLYPSRPST
jgi:menaquinol-cytochrome c reductase iron-sulfur subunit